MGWNRMDKLVLEEIVDYHDRYDDDADDGGEGGISGMLASKFAAVLLQCRTSQKHKLTNKGRMNPIPT